MTHPCSNSEGAVRGCSSLGVEAGLELTSCPASVFRRARPRAPRTSAGARAPWSKWKGPTREKRSAARVGSAPFTPRKALVAARAALRFARKAKGGCGAVAPPRRVMRTLAPAGGRDAASAQRTPVSFDTRPRRTTWRQQSGFAHSGALFRGKRSRQRAGSPRNRSAEPPSPPPPSEGLMPIPPKSWPQLAMAGRRPSSHSGDSLSTEITGTKQ